MNLNFKKVGEGEPLVILHGLFGSLDNWLTFAKKLG
jgi:pimeloyl-ACP methyl ester carboxylesterase